ncbi:Nlpc/p60 superfamily protein [Equine molluscum contagiosum-like virus]|nr:Nlpc/p60 superfamily protein [Equine molluscum contagiosum-like virus]
MGVPARGVAVVREHACRGAVLFSNAHGPTAYFNPSAEKHAALYFGRGLASHLLQQRVRAPQPLADDARYVVEFNTGGMRVVELEAYLRAKDSVKLYYYVEAGAPDVGTMARAAGFAFEDIDKAYGFGPRASYCFKTVARCYQRAGVRVRPERLLGRDVVLSQCFTRDPHWVCVYDSASGACLLPWHRDYLKWRVDG